MDVLLLLEKYGVTNDRMRGIIGAKEGYKEKYVPLTKCG